MAEAHTPADVLAQIDAAQAMVSDLCHGRRRWLMSIPADEARDPDLVIGRALRSAESEILRLRNLSPGPAPAAE